MLRKYLLPTAILRRTWQLFVLFLLAIAVLPSAARAATLTSITVGPNVTLPVGLSRQVTATGNYSDGTMQDLTTQVTWASSAPSVATISNSSGSQGVATAVGLGVTTITATLGSVVGSDPLRVKTLSSLSVSPTVTSICPNASIQFYAQGTFSDGTTQYLTSSVTWTSSNTNIATIAINYVNLSASATGVSPGTVTISAQAGSIMSSATLNVKTLSYVTVSPTNPSIFLGGGISMAGLAWGIVLLVAVPRGFGGWPFSGPIWRSTYPLVLPQMLFVIGQGIGLGVGTGLGALGAARRSLRMTLLGSVLFVVGSLVGAVAGGAAGTLWGAAFYPMGERVVRVVATARSAAASRPPTWRITGSGRFGRSGGAGAARSWPPRHGLISRCRATRYGTIRLH